MVDGAGLGFALVACDLWSIPSGLSDRVAEILGVPYTGSGVLASSLCMHKRKCNQVLKAAGLSVPIDIPLAESGPLRYPVVLKPLDGNHGRGVSRELSFNDRPGVREILLGKLSGEKAVCRDDASTMHVLPAGKLDGQR